ncbi:MAG: cytochrome c-553 [Gammaproteobacteria bacterium]|nr:cytochrome c-553 [Gammaproteobacteria bacterium]MDH5303743.1 cytochrome c-553 [Gammaproteobacteria bacterium]MDH5322273.1 cytochrome c-553 [Gammaproteobacteria bacterium]
MRTYRLILTAAALCFAWLQIPLASADVGDLDENCDGCHGESGVSTEGDVPSIAGVSAFVLEEYMLEYRDRVRPCRESKYRSGDLDRPATDMCTIAEELTDEQITELAEHFAAKTYVPAQQAFDAALAAEGSKIHRRSCEKCHSDGGSLAEDEAGMLAGQWMPYLEQVFADYASGQRNMMEDTMKEKIDELDAASITALLHYYASLQ